MKENSHIILILVVISFTLVGITNLIETGKSERYKACMEALKAGVKIECTLK